MQIGHPLSPRKRPRRRDRAPNQNPKQLREDREQKKRPRERTCKAQRMVPSTSLRPRQEQQSSRREQKNDPLRCIAPWTGRLVKDPEDRERRSPPHTQQRTKR